MSYIVRLKDGDVWELEAPDGTILLSDNDLPVTTPDDIEDAVINHAGDATPLYLNNYEIVDKRGR